MSLYNLLQVEHSLQFQTASITKRGLLCDRDETHHQIDVYNAGIEVATDRLKAFGLSPSVTTDEGRQALEAMLLSAGCHPERTPKSQKLKVGADDLRLAVMEADDDTKGIVDDLVFIRQAEKIKAAYLNAFLESAEYDGRVHPSINTMGARTHRMSISQPPLQQIPSHPMTVEMRDMHNAIVRQELDTRGCLVADPGCLLVSADYAQIEQRVMATLAGEAELIKGIKAGIDFHTVTASGLYKTPQASVTHEQRELAKRCGYLMIYGGGARRLALVADIPLKEAGKTIKGMRAEWKHFVRYAKRLAEQEEIVTPFGRHLPIDEARRYAAANYMIQSSARDLFVIGGVRIIKAGYGEMLWLPVHDEWILNAPEDKAERIAKELGEIMAIDFYGTPITAEGIVLGKSWRKP